MTWLLRPAVANAATSAPWNSTSFRLNTYATSEAVIMPTVSSGRPSSLRTWSQSAHGSSSWKSCGTCIMNAADAVVAPPRYTALLSTSISSVKRTTPTGLPSTYSTL